MRLPVLPLLLAASLAPAPADAQARSPTVDSLRSAAEGRDTLPTDAFWRGVRARTAPLVEEDPASDSLLVTFLWRGDADTRNVLVYGALTGWLPPANLLKRVPGTDVWHLSAAAPGDARFTYRQAENQALTVYWDDPGFPERVRTFRPDPLNPDTVPIAGGQRASYFVGPAFEPGPWTAVREPEAGRRDSLRLGERRVRLYLPPGTDTAGEVGLAVTMDGGAYDALVSAPATVEALVVSGAIPPTVLVMMEHVDRSTELPPNEPFLRFVADTLFPALDARLPLSPDPSRSAVVGSSLGGLAAAWLGFRLSGRFGAVVAQSGAYWWSPPGDDAGGWLQRRFAEAPRRDLRVYLDAGLLEAQPVRGGVSMLRLTQHMRDVLCAKGYEVGYRVFPGGHEYEHWRATLPGALAWALGPRTPGDAGRGTERSSTDDVERGGAAADDDRGPRGLAGVPVERVPEPCTGLARPVPGR